MNLREIWHKGYNQKLAMDRIYCLHRKKYHISAKQGIFLTGQVTADFPGEFSTVKVS